MLRLYLLPIEGTGTKADPRRAKYSTTDLAGVPYTLVDYGHERACLLTADTTTAQHNALVQHQDVLELVVEALITTSGSLGQVQRFMELGNIPADWVTATMTWHAVLLQVVPLFHFLQVATSVNATPLFGPGVTLDTAWGQLPAAVRDALLTTAAQLSLDTSAITSATLLRSALMTLSRQTHFSPLQIGEIVL